MLFVSRYMLLLLVCVLLVMCAHEHWPLLPTVLTSHIVMYGWLVVGCLHSLVEESVLSVHTRFDQPVC